MIKPTIEQIAEEIKLKGYTTIDAEHFFHYNESRGWKIGKQPMEKWRSCLAVWNRNAMRNSTHAMAVNQRDEAYTQQKQVYMKPIKKKPANPRIAELNKESFALTKSLRHMTLSGRIKARATIKEIGRQILAIRDNDNKVGEILK